MSATSSLHGTPRMSHIREAQRRFREATRRELLKLLRGGADHDTAVKQLLLRISEGVQHPADAQVDSVMRKFGLCRDDAVRALVVEQALRRLKTRGMDNLQAIQDLTASLQGTHLGRRREAHPTDMTVEDAGFCDITLKGGKEGEGGCGGENAGSQVAGKQGEHGAEGRTDGAGGQNESEKWTLQAAYSTNGTDIGDMNGDLCDMGEGKSVVIVPSAEELWNGSELPPKRQKHVNIGSSPAGSEGGAGAETGDGTVLGASGAAGGSKRQVAEGAKKSKRVRRGAGGGGDHV